MESSDQYLSNNNSKNRIQSLLALYESSSSDDDSDSTTSTSSSDDNIEIPRVRKSPFDSEDESSDDDEDNDDVENNTSGPKGRVVVKTEGELGLDDLPPIQELRISMPPGALRNFGSIVSIVERLVVVQSIRGTPALNLDSILFFLDGTPIGEIYDVFGPVNEPLYSIRFNSVNDIEHNDKIKVGAAAYYLPAQHGRKCPTVNGHQITDYVFVDQLKKDKGSDASWKHNNEPPEDLLDYSDDEEERRARAARAVRRHNQQRPWGDTPQDQQNTSRGGHACVAKKPR